MLTAISVTSSRSRRAILHILAIEASTSLRRVAALSIGLRYSDAMPRYQTLPHIWLISDERNDAVLETALGRLPRGSGFIYRHYHLTDTRRRERFCALERVARGFDHAVIMADNALKAAEWGADGVYGHPRALGQRRTGLLRFATADSLEAVFKRSRRRAAR